MTRILLTAFGPYDQWRENASWLAVQELTRETPESVDLTTRLYPVDFAEARQRMASDLAAGFDASIHLGQAPGKGVIALEAIGLNVARDRGVAADEAPMLEPDGPPAYRSALPLGEWARMLRDAGAPAEVSFHAGEYLCNAALYWSHHFTRDRPMQHGSVFVHVPLDTSQVVAAGRDLPSLPSAITALAVRMMIERLALAPVTEIA
ncbi:Pyrrolidone-carboxylate peptidase [Pseudobythopirellula maris]|uniref:Pyrrolidone-carboxylate peptidase n=1 Tax=Pseudobythopirellula maris TaxID=2527991 RepID=A0A5C5ZU30_9BACT|nr:pyroglutamyl-peptidase I [Pseudobythopirellula maris]TWT90567.1 Pyrrolidone-carboxylate peptidase [Pseudobythopirellula maris]